MINNTPNQTTSNSMPLRNIVYIQSRYMKTDGQSYQYCKYWIVSSDMRQMLLCPTALHWIMLSHQIRSYSQWLINKKKFERNVFYVVSSMPADSLTPHDTMSVGQWYPNPLPVNTLVQHCKDWRSSSPAQVSDPLWLIGMKVDDAWSLCSA